MRRQYGTGGLYQRKSDGRWIGKISDGHGGHRYVTGTDEDTVKARLKALPKSSTSVRPSTETVAELLTRWLDDAAISHLRPRTVESYQLLIDRHIVPAVGSLRIGDLEAPDVQRMVTGMLRAGLSQQTAKHAHKVLRVALGQALRWGIVPRNVASLVQSPKVVRRSPRTLTVEQARTFLASVRDDGRYALYVLALTTGMRRGELLALRWPDVDLERGTVTVASTLRQVSRWRFAYDVPKTARSRRTLPLSRLAIDALTRHRSQALSAVVVFARADGRPWPPAEVTRVFQVRLTEAGLPKITFHALRHTAAALMLDQSAGDLRVVMGMLGHSTISTTVDLYGGIADAAKRRAADGMDRLFAPATSDTSVTKT